MLLLLGLVVGEHLLAGRGEPALAEGKKHLRGAGLHGINDGVSGAEAGVDFGDVVERV